MVIDYDWGGGEVTGAGWLVGGWLVGGWLVVGCTVVGLGLGEGDCGAGGEWGREVGGTGDDGLCGGAVEVGGQLVEGGVVGGVELAEGDDGVAVLGLGEEAQGVGVGVDTLADGVRFTGGSVLWSWRPVSPRCRPIHSWWSGSYRTKTLMTRGAGVTTTTSEGW